MTKLDSRAGIAIGPILFIIAIMGALAAAFAASSSGGFGTAGTSDRITNDVVGQANLIRSKIAECQLQYEVNGTNFASAPCALDSYPCSDQDDGTLVSALTCPNDPLVSAAQQSVWTGLRVTPYPQASKGMDEWMYINAGDAGGRCIWTAPTNGNHSGPIVEGLKRAAEKFSSSELLYDPNSESQKFVIIITPPTDTADSHCTVP
ncbi:MAG: hypothetical protein EOM37_04925 [Proteobacteria bacterium]|jgi:hypothetical protein|nr:hypothetical protein [Alphaproteobacteria bacterium]NCC03376.1 hypothetical protein [Pseudomonadota bacterium]